MIYQRISKEMLLSIAEKKKAKDAWLAIKTLCQGADRAKTAKIQTPKLEFESLVMKDTEHVDDFSMKLSGIVTNIRALGEVLDESYVVKKFLRAVPSRFLHIVSTMEQFSNMETLTVEEVVGSLKAHEERTKGMSENSRGQSSGGQLLMMDEEWSKKEKEEGKLLLTREEWLKRNERNREEDKDIVLLNESEVLSKLNSSVDKRNVKSSIWYLDNGASNHITGDKSKFKELNKEITGQVKFGDGSMVKIEEEGNRVLIGNFQWVYDNKERLLIKVQRSQNRLYKLLIETSSSACLMSKSSDTSWLWHMRMGHVNYQSLVMMNKNQMVYDLCGPIQPATSVGNKYFMLLVDDYSRAMWVFMLKHKDEALSVLKKFRA
ncbi:uncharacterized protein LOC141660556 [Apium graveolens]|uniref:uncharacterized protein LOC141660556 n=1 Tax=Apium graveolens TaxID=4045 RepID=UPI003D7BAD05